MSQTKELGHIAAVRAEQQDQWEGPPIQMITHAPTEVEILRAENERLRQENARLKEELGCSE